MTGITLSSNNTFVIRKSKMVTYTPLPDITVFELAQALPILFSIGRAPYVEDLIGKLPIEVQRHFTVQE